MFKKKKCKSVCDEMNADTFAREHLMCLVDGASKTEIDDDTQKMMDEDGIDYLLQRLESEDFFGRDTCRDFDIECAQCKGQMLIGLIRWLKEIHED